MAAIESDRSRPLWRSYLLSVLGWIAFGTLLHWQEHIFYMPDQPLWPGIATEPWLQYGPHALLWPLVLRAAERWLSGTRRALRLGALWLCATLSFLVLRATLRWCTRAVSAAVAPSFVPWLFEEIGRGIAFDGFVWAGLVGSAAAIAQTRAAVLQTQKTAQLREQLLHAQLGLLKSRLQPHFLFNALHAVAVVAHRSADEAEHMLALLGDLLRDSLRERGRDLVTLAEELRLLAPYLELQRIRFQDRLQLTVAVPLDLQRCAVPDLLLQPLVENALQHGIERKAGAGSVTITAVQTGANLLLTVADDGHGLAESAGEGIGLGTTRERLRALFGDAARLDLRPRPGGGTEARVQLPWREVEHG